MASAVDDPLAILQSQIDRAASLPSAEPYTPSTDPLARLRGHLRGEVDEAANDDAAPALSAPRPADGADSSLEAMLGREVLSMIANRPLPPEAREEAVRRLAIALQNPAPANIRSVLAVLITGRDDA